MRIHRDVRSQLDANASAPEKIDLVAPDAQEENFRVIPGAIELLDEEEKAQRCAAKPMAGMNVKNPLGGGSHAVGVYVFSQML